MRSDRKLRQTSNDGTHGARELKIVVDEEPHGSIRYNSVNFNGQRVDSIDLLLRRSRMAKNVLQFSALLTNGWSSGSARAQKFDFYNNNNCQRPKCDNGICIMELDARLHGAIAAYIRTSITHTHTITSYINYCDPNSSRDLNWMHAVSAFYSTFLHIFVCLCLPPIDIYVRVYCGVLAWRLDTATSPPHAHTFFIQSGRKIWREERASEEQNEKTKEKKPHKT